MQYAQNLALLLRSGSLVAPVNFIQERTVGPSLGKANIHKGVLSVEVGAALVIIFMMFYYRLFGLVADVALVLNIIFIIALLSLVGATLTLAGIAAIVLTVGMAVDANVLINERIREELRNGISPQASIQMGYARAFSTIVDANVSTLIVALILFALGSGSVKGFAVILIIGLLTSMVTAIFFTRGIINLIYGGRSVKTLSIGIKIPPNSSNPKSIIS
jgi:preprotein translocase subunit SecD